MEDWLKTAEVMQLCGWTHRGSVTRVARREKWRVQKPHEFHPEYRYHRDDIQAYLRHRQRTALLNDWFTKKRSKRVRGLVRDERYDTTCPVCGQYAVYEPLTPNDDALAFIENAEERKRKTRCINGHEST